MLAPGASMRRTWRTAARFSPGGPTMKARVNTEERPISMLLCPGHANWQSALEIAKGSSNSPSP